MMLMMIEADSGLPHIP